MPPTKPDPTAWWNMNIPTTEHTVAVPIDLAGCSERDAALIGADESGYAPLSWEQCRAIVAANDLEAFSRSPLELRRYRRAMYALAATHGSVASFLANERIGWGEGEIKPHGTIPFETPEDYKIVYNDWPYGLDPRIVHLVVWTKFQLVEDPATGRLTALSAKQIDDFVGRTFRSRVPAENVIWFKNWSAIKSVQALEHFHVLMFEPDTDFIREITNGDRPLCEKF
ncbi:N-acetylglucosamine-induced protein 1 [Ceratocystis fimbriata CBS 114723]|uniref:N-acetylglucosamine-induced protein 1 n=1 Tax=Ceratocystis fimbriata CBS 114723 TaxID=1035309 RepID=A0A2C5X4H1_9PEZI|nr:N-acetylglucosamine-induced protein 1 [Ceratocystis fimbriata CBS 114723]